MHNKFGLDFEAYSVIKPNAILETVASSLACECSNLGDSNHRVVLGGTTNIECRGKFGIKVRFQEISEAEKTVFFFTQYHKDTTGLNLK